MSEQVWYFRAWRHLVTLLVNVGLSEIHAIETAQREIEPMIADRSEYETPEDAAQAAYEAMADAA